MARSGARRPLDRNQPPGTLVARRREPGVAGAVRRAVCPRRHGQPALHAEHRGGCGRHAGTRDVPRRGDRQADLGAAVQRVPERRPAAQGGLGLPGSRSGDGQHLRIHRWRTAPCARARREDAVEPFDGGRVRCGHHAWRAHRLARHRWRQGGDQRAQRRLGRSGAHEQPVLRLRQAHRRVRSGSVPRRPGTTTPTTPRPSPPTSAACTC